MKRILKGIPSAKSQHAFGAIGQGQEDKQCFRGGSDLRRFSNVEDVELIAYRIPQENRRDGMTVCDIVTKISTPAGRPGSIEECGSWALETDLVLFRVSWPNSIPRCGNPWYRLPFCKLLGLPTVALSIRSSGCKPVPAKVERSRSYADGPYRSFHLARPQVPRQWCQPRAGQEQITHSVAVSCSGP